MEVITTKRGGQKLCHDGFMNTKKTESKKADQLVWRCVKRDDPVPCSATLQTTKTLTNPLLQKSHTHEADQNAITSAEVQR